MSSETVRGLSRRYAVGDIDRESYRLQRRELIEAIAGGDTELVAYQRPEPETPTVFPYEDDEGDTTQEIMPPVEPEAAGGFPKYALPALVIGAVLLVAAAASWWLWGGRGDLVDPPTVASHDDVEIAPAPPVVPGQSPAPVAVIPEPEPEPDAVGGTAPLADPIKDFLDTNVWDAAALDAFAQDWVALDADHRAQLADQGSLQRLGDELAGQLNANQALIDLGDAIDADNRQRSLLDFADRLGLDNDPIAQAREHLAAAMAGSAPLEGTTTADAVESPGELDELEALELEETGTDLAPVADLEPAPAPPLEPALQPAAPAVDATATAASAEPDVTEAPARGRTDDAPQAIAEPAPAATATAPAQAIAAASVPAVAATADPAPAAPPKRTASTSRGKTNCNAELADTRRPYCIEVMPSGEKSPVMVVLPRGTFRMGGTAPEEQPVHQVDIDYDFAIGLFEVSVAELQRFCAATGTSCPAQPWSDQSMPAVNVSWNLAQAYTAWLSTQSGAVYRLPSEAEWEYAARAGSDADFPSGTDEILPTHAHFSFRAAQTKPLPANDRSINRNDFRLYHMAGNVREWVADTWHDSHAGGPADGSARAGGGARRVVRGGSYADGAPALRSAARLPLDAGNADAFTGFRIVRIVED